MGQTNRERVAELEAEVRSLGGELARRHRTIGETIEQRNNARGQYHDARQQIEELEEQMQADTQTMLDLRCGLEATGEECVALQKQLNAREKPEPEIVVHLQRDGTSMRMPVGGIMKHSVTSNGHTYIAGQMLCTRHERVTESLEQIDALIAKAKGEACNE